MAIFPPFTALSRSSDSTRPAAAASQGRSAGALAISLKIRSSSATGISGTLTLGRGGGWLSWQCIRTTAEAPEKAA